MRQYTKRELCEVLEKGKKEKSALSKAEELINGDRKEKYGSPTKLFSHVAKLWEAYLDDRGTSGELWLEPSDVANMMVLLKMARQQHKHDDDNIVDMAGYVGVLDKIKKGE